MPLRIVLVAIALAAAPLIAGCANPVPQTASAGSEPVEPMTVDWYEKALARDAGHDHNDFAQHQDMSTPNFVVLGHDALLTRSGSRWIGSWGCGEAGETPEGRRLAILDGFQTSVHVIADVTDPAHPFKLGEIRMSGVSSWDDTITPDGRWVAIGLNTLARMPTLAPPARVSASFVDACGNPRAIEVPDLAVTSGVMLFDLADPTRPVYADYWPTPTVNMHSVSAAIVDGHTYLAASTVALAYPPTYFSFLEVLDTPVGGRLVHLSTFAPPPVSVAGTRAFVPTYNGHDDATIQKHPIDGRTYAYLAAWDGGMITLDLTVPVAPVMVAMWAPPTSGFVSSGIRDNGCYPWAIHTTFPFPEAWNGKHYLIAGQECPYQSQPAPAGELFILDNTDPWHPTMVGRWNLPLDTSPWTIEYQASPHYVALAGKTLLASMYHAGLWAIDLSGDLAYPPSIGVYMPAIHPGVENSGAIPGKPTTEQVNVLSNGDIMLYEDASGVYMLRFDATNPAPPAPPRFR